MTEPGAALLQTLGIGPLLTFANSFSELSDTPDTGVDATIDDTITVELVGLPEDAVVLVDGEPVGWGDLTLPADGAVHAIEVSSGTARWTTDHVADADGRYDVELHDDAAPQMVRRPVMRPVMRPRMRPRMSAMSRRQR